MGWFTKKPVAIDDPGYLTYLIKQSFRVPIPEQNSFEKQTARFTGGMAGHRKHYRIEWMCDKFAKDQLAYTAAGGVLNQNRVASLDATFNAMKMGYI
jgi:hypothetical protein